MRPGGSPTPAPTATPTARSASRPPADPRSALARLEAGGTPRKIPVPQASAQLQFHGHLTVDGEQVLLDGETPDRLRPLLVVLHGLGSSGAAIRRQTGFTALAALRGFDVAYPNAHLDSTTPASSPHSTAHSAAASSSGPAARPAAYVAAAGPPPAATAATAAVPRGTPTAGTSAPGTFTPSASRTPPPSRPPSATPTSAPPTGAPPTVAPPTGRAPASPSPHAITPSSTPPAATSARPAPSNGPAPAPATTPIRAWNAGSCCSLSRHDDVRYLVDVVRALATTVPIDTKQVYVVGFSNGGMMALDAVCSAPTVFAAAGSVAGPYLGGSCARPVWRHLAAAGDPIVPPAGGVPPGLPFLGITPDWCGCAFPATTTETQRFGPFASVRVVDGASHAWPAPNNPGFRYDAEDDLWNFVSQWHL